MFRAVIFVCTLLTIALSQSPPLRTVKITYDGIYDFADLPVDRVSCGGYPLFSNYSVISSIPNWPNVGGGFVVTESDQNCGTCWLLTYTETGQNAAILLIDIAESGFNIAESTMDRLTDGMAEELGVINATVERLPAYECGIHP